MVVWDEELRPSWVVFYSFWVVANEPFRRLCLEGS